MALVVDKRVVAAVQTESRVEAGKTANRTASVSAIAEQGTTHI